MTSISGLALANPSGFNDVEGNDKELFINYLASSGVFNGFPDGSFKPLEVLTRAEAATVIVKAMNLPINNEEATFSDVDGHWANHYIAATQSAGLISGFPDKTFRPEQGLTRAEAVSLLLRMSQEITQTNNYSLPPDVDKNHWAATAISNSIESGMVSIGNANFFPESSMTREDLAQALAILLTNATDLYKTNLNPILKVRKGTVKLTSLGMSEGRNIEKNITIKIGDKIATADSSEAEIIFPDGSGILIKPNTLLIIKGCSGRAYIKKEGKPGNAIDSLELQLDKGKIFGGLATSYDISQIAGNYLNNQLLASLDNKFDLVAINGAQKDLPWHKQNQAKKVKVKVDMPWGVAAIRGTFWSNTVEENGVSTTSVLSGEAEFTSGGQTVVVGQGQSSTIDRENTPPTPVHPMNSQEFLEWTEQENWVLNRGADMNNQLPANSFNLGAPLQPVTNVLNNAYNQVRASIPAPPPRPSSESSGSSGGGAKNL